MSVGSAKLALVLVLVAPLAILLALPPMPQDPAYHAFADGRTFFGVPNFVNVSTNVPFLAVGLLGLTLCLGKRVRGAAVSWGVFFAAIALVSAGSGYYHLDPDDSRLVWDRLLMTVAFMALFAAVLAEHLDARTERFVLPAALLVGLSSLAWWRYADDLRLYAWVQLAPFLAIVLMLAAFPARYGRRSYLAYGLVLYVLAKLAEVTDHAIFEMTSETVSGHTIKHLLGACATASVYCMLRAREPL